MSLTAEPQQTASRPATSSASTETRPAGPRPFQPGVELDWAARRVLIRARVVLREGPLEYFAAGPGKEHESILRIEARLEHVFMALGLLGYQAGRPAGWDEAGQRFFPPEGELIGVSVAVAAGEPGRAAGADVRAVDAFDWLSPLGGGPAPIPRPWVFGGSRRGSDGAFLADLSGAGLALVDSSDAVLGLSQRHSDSDAELWAQARTDAIPPLGTPVVLILQPPHPLPDAYRLSPDGRPMLGDRVLTLDDAADLMRLRHRLQPDLPLKLVGERRDDSWKKLRAALGERGVDPAWWAAP